MFPRIRWSSLWIASIWLAACSSPTVQARGASEHLHTRGTITEVPARLSGAAFLIEEKVTGLPAEPSTAGDKYFVFVTEKTGIQRRTSGGSVQSASLAEITEGTRAEVWFDGPIRESYPAQATASRILILDPAQ